jgi:hypothetical protein
LTVIGPPHHPHVDAASRRTCAADSTCAAELSPGSPDGETVGCPGDWGFDARPRGKDRREAFLRLLMPVTVRVNVPADVTPMRHDGTMVLDAPGVCLLILAFFSASWDFGKLDVALGRRRRIGRRAMLLPIHEHSREGERDDAPQ